MTTLSIGILPFQVSFLSFNPKAKGRGHYYLIFKTSAKEKSFIKPKNRMLINQGAIIENQKYKST